MKVLVCLSIVIAGVFGRASIAPRAALPDGRIIGGHDAERNQYPYHASVQYGSGSTFQHACSGVIISPTTVISAGHCITSAPSLGSYRVLVGVLNLNDDNAERQFVRVAFVLVHPDYKGGINPHDIALFKLSEPIAFSEAVTAANLPPIDYHESGDAEVVGWGSIGGSETPIMPSTEQTANVTIINSTACREALDKVLAGSPHPLDDDNNICTGPLTGGVSICTGDSGGPLVYTRFDNSREVIGISSWGITPCGTVGAPSVYVKVQRYLTWIRAHMFD